MKIRQLHWVNVKQNAHSSSLGDYFWQIVDGDLDMFVFFCKRKGESPNSPTDVDNSRIFLERKLCVSGGQVSTASQPMARTSQN